MQLVQLVALRDINMRAREFIGEQRSDSLMKDVSHTLPPTYAIPQLKNQDPYLQYRFGVAIAAAKARKVDSDNVEKYSKETPWGENQVVVSYGDDVGQEIDAALQTMGMPGKRRVSSKTSAELPDTDKQSPVKPFKGYAK